MITFGFGTAFLAAIATGYVMHAGSKITNYMLLLVTKLMPAIMR